MIDVFLLEQLDAFARTGTLSRAAEELHITQPALSRNMKKLEATLGVSLFNRESSKITLNETGKIAAEYARRALDANQEMIEMTLAFDRRERSLALGSCTILPIYDVLPLLQERFIGKAITTELSDRERLLANLRNHQYQLIILADLPEDGDLYCQRLIEDRLCVSFVPDHPLAQKEAITFADLQDISLIAAGNAGYWIYICEQNLPPRNLVIQNNVEALAELVSSSSMPVFSSQRLVDMRNAAPGRVTVPIMDESARAVFYLICLNSEKNKYTSLFNAVRTRTIRNYDAAIPFLKH